MYMQHNYEYTYKNRHKTKSLMPHNCTPLQDTSCRGIDHII